VFLKIPKKLDSKINPSVKTKALPIYTQISTLWADTKTTMARKVEHLQTSGPLRKGLVWGGKKMISPMNKNYKLLCYLRSMVRKRICTKPYINLIQKNNYNNNIMIPIKYIIKTHIAKTEECLPLIPSSSRDSRKTSTKKIVIPFYTQF
jgi:hypothetical protein